VSDDEGYIYVADKLRCVVIIFDKEFRFQNEFGHRSLRPGGLIAPNDLEVDTQGRIYVKPDEKKRDQCVPDNLQVIEMLRA